MDANAVDHENEQEHIKAGQFVKSAVYGGLDGIITTLSVALSGIGSGSGAAIIVALGLSSLIADAMSMGVADYLATKSDEQYMKSEQKRELAEMQQDFEAQQQQMIQIYKKMGISEQNSQKIVQILSTNKKGFLKIMMIQQLQLIVGEQNPLKNSIVTFFSFIIFGIMPLIPFIIASVNSIQLGTQFIIITISIATLFLFVLGFAKSFVTSAKWYASTIETIIIGAVSAGAAYAIGLLLAF